MEPFPLVFIPSRCFHRKDIQIKTPQIVENAELFYSSLFSIEIAAGFV